MRREVPITREERIKNLRGEVEKLQSQLKKANTGAVADESIQVRLGKAQAHFKRERNPKGPDVGIGTFLLFVDVTALQETVYIPISIASGKKPTGFVYQIEGTGKGGIATARISCEGDGVTQVTLGTLVYAKIPEGSTATFRAIVEMEGQVEKSYTVVLSRIHYKRNPSDARYIRFLEEIRSNALRFR